MAKLLETSANHKSLPATTKPAGRAAARAAGKSGPGPTLRRLNAAMINVAFLLLGIVRGWDWNCGFGGGWNDPSVVSGSLGTRI
jgi:hypothetical protein